VDAATVSVLSRYIVAEVTKKNKKMVIKPHMVKNHMRIFVNAKIDNPTFDSQVCRPNFSMSNLEAATNTLTTYYKLLSDRHMLSEFHLLIVLSSFQREGKSDYHEFRSDSATGQYWTGVHGVSLIGYETNSGTRSLPGTCDVNETLYPKTWTINLKPAPKIRYAHAAHPFSPVQTKDTMTLKVSSFGSKCDLPDPLLKKIAACGIMELVTSTAQMKEQRGLKKGDGAKRSRLVGAHAALFVH
jgi:hypothetical protein